MTNRPVVKICGIKDLDILQCALDEGVDLVGFVHFPKSPRHIDLKTVGGLIKKAGNAQSVVLLVDPDDQLVEKVSRLGPDFIQLHGHETPDRVTDIRTRCGKKIIKALAVGGPDDLPALEAYRSVADLLLLDAKPPKSATRPGGLGVPFDWSLLDGLDPDMKFMLSGGLTPDNVADAISRVRPMGVDVSSGVETRPGGKDMSLIRAFIKNARAALKDNI